MSKRKSPLPRIREMKQRVEETFAGLICRADVEAEIAAAEAMIRSTRRVHHAVGIPYCVATGEPRRACPICRALAHLDRASGRSE